MSLLIIEYDLICDVIARPSADGFGNIVIWQRFQDGCVTGLKWLRREEIYSSPRGLRLQKEKRPREGGHRVKAIRNWQLIRERTRMPLQSINCGD